MNNKVRHKLITGHSGAGKSTLAKSFGLPIYALDDHPLIREQLNAQMQYAKNNEGRLPTEKKYQRAMDLAEIRAIRDALKQSTPHVIEGSYLLNYSPHKFKNHDLHLVDTPENVVLDRRVSRQKKKDLERGRHWDNKRAAGVRSRGQQLIEEYRPGVEKWRKQQFVKKSSIRDYRKEYLRDHASRKAKVNRAKRNLWNRRLKGKVPQGKEIDHKVPLSKGGGNGSNNIRYRSVSANRSDNQMKKLSMNDMDRKMLGEVYRRLIKERARAKAHSNDEMVRILSEELLELQLLLEGPKLRSTLD